MLLLAVPQEVDSGPQRAAPSRENLRVIFAELFYRLDQGVAEDVVVVPGELQFGVSRHELEQVRFSIGAKLEEFIYGAVQFVVLILHRNRLEVGFDLGKDGEKILVESGEEFAGRTAPLETQVAVHRQRSMALARRLGDFENLKALSHLAH